MRPQIAYEAAKELAPVLVNMTANEPRVSVLRVLESEPSQKMR